MRVNLRGALCVPLLVAVFLSVQTTVMAQTETSGQVTVMGAVQRTGTVLVSGDTISAHDVVQLAGGLQPDAYAFGALLLRRNRNTLYEGSAKGGCISLQNRQAMEAVRSLLPADDAAELVSALRVGALTRMPVALRSTASAIAAPEKSMLIDGDILIVPPRPAVVYVGGVVTSPGFYPYEPGAIADDYLGRAGKADGASVFARDIMLLPDGVLQPLHLRFFNYQPAAVPPGAMLLFGIGDKQRCPGSVDRP